MCDSKAVLLAGIRTCLVTLKHFLTQIYTIDCQFCLFNNYLRNTFYGLPTVMSSGRDTYTHLCTHTQMICTKIYTVLSAVKKNRKVGELALGRKLHFKST